MNNYNEKHYITIYIDELFEKELYLNTNILTIIEDDFQKFIKQFDLTHAFLGLTRKHPDELDKVDEQLRQEYLKNKEWGKID
ncbi:hypothetical protein CHLV3229_10245, partial [Campylobacter helveticus]|nr:hypothetical protein [Campylobacter helveticus]